MKNIFFAIIMVFTISLIIPTYMYAQESQVTETPVTTTTQPKEEVKTLSEELKTQTTKTQPKKMSFWTLLVAVLTPALFIIIGYMLIKFLKL